MVTPSGARVFAARRSAVSRSPKSGASSATSPTRSQPLLPR
ncbi:hypothetical protein [Rhodobacter capsulatus]